MKNRFYIFYFISKVVQYNSSGLMVFNNSNYFIYQEKDYCKKDIHSKEMLDLYEKKNYFSQNGKLQILFL